ncbi:MAG: hypothetical protein RLZ45_3020 [Verrucomicrobiota bacterium]|jgi:hypothetical protein
MGAMPRRSVSGGNALILNLATTPGLGSFLAGRRWVGSMQMLMAVSGFVVLMLWFWDLARQFWDLLQSSDTVVRPDTRQLMAGGILFGGAWLWSLWTSISILRQSKDGAPSTSVPGPTSPHRGR